MFGSLFALTMRSVTIRRTYLEQRRLPGGAVNRYYMANLLMFVM